MYLVYLAVGEGLVAWCLLSEDGSFLGSSPCVGQSRCGASSPGRDRAEKVEGLNAVSLWGGHHCSPIPRRSRTAYCPAPTSGRRWPADLEHREGH